MKGGILVDSNIQLDRGRLKSMAPLASRMDDPRYIVTSVSSIKMYEEGNGTIVC